MGLAATLLAPESFAQWQPGGLPVAAGPGAQFLSGVVSDGASGVFVAWLDATSGHSRLLHVDGNGYASPGWPAQGIDVAGAQAEVLSDLIADGTGGVILFATSPTGAFPGVRAYRFDANGAIPSPWPAAGRQVTGAISGTGITIRAVTDAMGGAFAYWTHYGRTCQGGDGHDCYNWVSLAAARVMSDGSVSPSYPPLGLASDYTTNFGLIGIFATLIPDGGGGIVELLHNNNNGQNSEAVHLDSAGNQLARRTFTNQLNTRGCLLPGGDFLVATGDPTTESGEMDVHVYRLTPLLADAAGWPATGSSLGVSGVQEILQQCISDGGPGAFLVWTDRTASPIVFRVQHVTGDPPPATSLWPAPGSLIPVWESRAFATDGTGGFASIGFDGGTQTLRALQLDAAGQVVPGTGPSGVSLGAPTSTSFQGTAATGAGPGGVIVAWSEVRAGDWNVYAQRLPLELAVSTMVAGVSAEQNSDGVRVTWRLDDGLASTLLAERSAEGADWQSVGALSEVSFDHATYEDHAVSAGHRYAYRLRIAGSDSPLVGSEVAVEFGSRPTNLLVGFVPSPAFGSPRVRFQLASGDVTELQILDIAGRLVARHDLRGLTAGPHELNAGRLAPGLYTLRLTGPSGTQVARGVVLR